MTREEFEIWIEDEDRVAEAIQRLPEDSKDRSIDLWLKLFALALKEIVEEESAKDPDEEEGDSELEELDLGGDD